MPVVGNGERQAGWKYASILDVFRRVLVSTRWPIYFGRFSANSYLNINFYLKGQIYIFFNINIYTINSITPKKNNLNMYLHIVSKNMNTKIKQSDQIF